jgi:protein TonB
VSKDRSVFRKALEVSLLLHLLAIFIIAPRVMQLSGSRGEAAVRFLPEPEAQQDRPLEFELVDLPDDREEPPENPDAPLSDLDRRAHGGEGEEAAARPETRGSTPQLVASEGAQLLPGRGAPPQQPGPRTQPVPPPERVEPRPEPRPREESPPQPEVRREGAGEEREPAAQPQPQLRLPPPGTWSLPPDSGGLPESPDRRGGHVDSGGLSFDTQWYDWGPYAKTMLAKIRRNWYQRMPEIARLGVQGVVRIRFFIERDGEVTGLVIMDESGKPPMDFAARDAIAASSAFDPLPSDLVGVDREGVTITFYYNMRPPEWEGR